MWLTWIVLPIHYLLQDKRDSAITERLRHAKAFKPVTIKTEKFRKSCRTLWITMISTLRTVQHHVLTPFDISHLGTSLVYISFVVLIKIFAAKPNKPPLCYHLPYMCCNYRNASMQDGHSHEQNVYLSVRLSVCQTHELWQNERNFCPQFIKYERTIILVFQHEDWLVGDDAFYLKFWAKLTLFEQKRRFQSIFAASAVRNI